MRNNYKELSNANFDEVKNLKGDIDILLSYFIKKYPNASEYEFLYFLNQYLLSQGKLKSSFSYCKQIGFDRYKKWRIFHKLKMLLKKMQRAYTKVRLRNIIGNDTVCILGPSKQCYNRLKKADCLILVKLYHCDQLEKFKTRKLILIWNGSACNRYLSSIETLPKNVVCILAKTNIAGLKAIKSANAHVSVLQYKTLNKAKWGEQTIIVDVIDIFSGVVKDQIQLTGFDLRVSTYRNDYEEIYKEHAQSNTMLKAFYLGHAPYSDFELIAWYFKENIINPDKELKEILNLNIYEYLALIEDRLESR